ncbi:MAG: hypothetical protein RLZZ468_172 [Cyanobacteriota bacterium]
MVQSRFGDTSADNCLGRSCMKWGNDGELSALDLQSILQRLGAVDEQASGLLDCPVEPQGR